MNGETQPSWGQYRYKSTLRHLVLGLECPSSKMEPCATGCSAKMVFFFCYARPLRKIEKGCGARKRRTVIKHWETLGGLRLGCPVGTVELNGLHIVAVLIPMGGSLSCT